MTWCERKTPASYSEVVFNEDSNNNNIIIWSVLGHKLWPNTLAFPALCGYSIIMIKKQSLWWHLFIKTCHRKKACFWSEVGCSILKLVLVMKRSPPPPPPPPPQKSQPLALVHRTHTLIESSREDEKANKLKRSIYFFTKHFKRCSKKL